MAPITISYIIEQSQNIRMKSVFMLAVGHTRHTYGLHFFFFGEYSMALSCYDFDIDFCVCRFSRHPAE